MPRVERILASRALKGERGLWQWRFWKNTVQDEDDLRRHLDYLHYNPVKHGLVANVADWPHSTFHNHVSRGLYLPDWGGRGDSDGGFGE
ncbi:MAG: transposase [Geobacteraceae bacterium]